MVSSLIGIGIVTDSMVCAQPKVPISALHNFGVSILRAHHVTHAAATDVMNVLIGAESRGCVRLTDQQKVEYVHRVCLPWSPPP